MPYVAEERQYVVVAAGGHDRLHTIMGDYVLAFTLPGPGAPVPDTTPGPLGGDYSGEMHIGDARFAMGLALRAAGDSFTANVSIDSVQIIGPVSARRSGRGVTVGFPLAYPAKRGCTATLTMTLQLWNGGRPLQGGRTSHGTPSRGGDPTAGCGGAARGAGGSCRG